MADKPLIESLDTGIKGLDSSAYIIETSSVEIEEQAGSEPESHELAPVGLADEQSSYFDDEFESLLFEGKIKGVEFGIGTQVDMVREFHGDPEWEDYWNGSMHMAYDNFAYGYIEGTNLIHVIGYKPGSDLSISEVKKTIGTPEYEGVSEKDGMYFLTYVLENHDELWIENLDEGKDSRIETIWLVRKDAIK